MSSSNKISQRNLHSNMPYKTHHCSWTPHFLHTRQTISAMLSTATTLQPPTTSLTLHAHLHSLHTQHYPCTPLPSTTLLWTQLTNTRHSWQNPTRCRDGENIEGSSHVVCLVFEGSAPTCAYFNSANFL